MAQIKNDNILVRAPKPIDDRLGFFLNGEWKLFATPEEALADQDIIRYRHLSMTIPIYDGVDQVEYWFVGGLEDENFVLKTTETGPGVVTTKGIIAFGAARLEIDWATDLVPDETITWEEKHGDLALVAIQTYRPDPIDDGFFTGTFDWKRDLVNLKVIIDNGGDSLQYLFLSKIPEGVMPFVPPIVYAGGNVSIILPTDSFSVTNATAEGVDGATIVSVLWEFISSTSGVNGNVLPTDELDTLLYNMYLPGVYVFRLTATDSNGSSSSQNKNITVVPDADAPIVYAGPDRTIYQSDSPLVISGATATPTAPATTIVAISWYYEYSVPEGLQMVIDSGNTLTPTFRNTSGDLAIGEYHAYMVAVDNLGNQASDQMMLTVLADLPGDNDYVDDYMVDGYVE